VTHHHRAQIADTSAEESEDMAQTIEKGIVAELRECRASLAQLRERAARVGSLARSVLAEAEAEDHLDVGAAIAVIEKAAGLCDLAAR
tara:strand:- start:149 stop:412 length:264 start_codon:yes stop_codon:yes gene_type:complete